MRRRHGHIIVQWFLDVLEEWAEGYWMIRESGIATPKMRLDALLVPVSQDAHCMKKIRGKFWKRPRLVGMEIKLSRNDFQRGLKKDQFAKYDSMVTGLYIVVPEGGSVCKMSEVPARFGFIEVNNHGHRGGWTLRCRRHPHYVDPDFSIEIPWRLMFQVREEMDLAIRNTKDKYKQRYKDLKDEVDCAVHRVIKQIEKQVIAREES
jgi:hypothetical protein